MKPNPSARRHFHVLFIALALLACAGVVAAATDSKTTPNYSLQTAHDQERSGEDRAFSVSAKFESLVSSLKQKKADKLFTKFKVGSIESKLLESPEFNRWAGAVAKTSKKNPEALMISPLTARFGDEGLAKILIAAKEVPRLETTVAKLEQAQLARWAANGKTADEMFELLKLNGRSGNFIESPIFSTWMAYATKLNEKNMDEFRVINVLTKNYNEVDLSNMFMSVEKSAEVGKTKALATELRAMLFNKWKSEDITPNMLAGIYLERGLHTPETTKSLVTYYTFYNN